MRGKTNNLNRSVCNAIAVAELEAKEFGVWEIDNLTLFLGILADAESAGAALLVSFAIDYATAKPVASKFYRFKKSTGALGQLEAALRNLQSEILGIPLSASANKIIESAVRSAQDRNSEVLGEDVLLSMLQSKDPEVLLLLSKLKINVSLLQDQLKALIERETQFD
jgi:ATP-dependent Clp protease ATP-binding subunit ClpA